MTQEGSDIPDGSPPDLCDLVKDKLGRNGQNSFMEIIVFGDF